MMHTISGNLVDIIHETIYPATLEIEGGRISRIRRKEGSEKNYLIPGFVDAHIHIESTLLPPSEFARSVLPHGVIATVSDPHEIANVLGISGVEYMLENASHVPLKCCFGVPSSVPATRFETSGASIGPKEVRALFLKDKLSYLSEVMDVPGVVSRDPEIMAKIAIAKELHKKIDGHAPRLSGEALKKYISAGIDTDHECTSLDEAREKIRLGMKILIRGGSAARDFEALFPLLLESPESCMLCSDDIDPEELGHGSINLLVKRGVERGADLMAVLRSASWNPIQHYGLSVGVLRVGDPADFIIVDNLRDFNVVSSYIDGNCVVEGKKLLFPRTIPKRINHFAARKKEVKEFRIPVQAGRVQVIEALDGQVLTGRCSADLPVVNGFVSADPGQDILKIAVINRYQEAAPGLGFIKNFGFKKGAIASSIAHDSHNIIAIGTDDELLCKAVNWVVAQQGGLVLVGEGVQECLALPIAGLMSDLEGREVALTYKKLKNRAHALGSSLKDPFMTLSFMALLVIPQLKLSDKGLFDGDAFTFTKLFESESI